MKKYKNLYLLLLCMLLLCGCGRSDEKDIKEPIKIPVTFLVNPENGIADNKKFIDEFNEAYKGTYEIDVHWITESVEGYREHLKQLNAQDKLPAIITDAAVDEEFYRLLVENDRLVDLTEYMDDEWKSMIQKDILEECTDENGNIYLSPISSPIYSYSGIYYNRKMLADAGYSKFPDNWEDFFKCMNALSEKGYTPLALHGSGTFWSPMLLATAYCAKTEEGSAFLHEQFPQNYDNEYSRDMFKFLKQIYNYSFEDALKLDFEKAQNRFFNGEAAMLPNGYWEIAAMDEEKQEEFGFAPFPGNVLMASPRMTAWAIPKCYNEEVTRGAAELLKYRVACSKRDSEEFLKTYGTCVEQDYKEALKEVRHVIPNYQLKWESDVQNEFFDEYVPMYVQDEITLEEFISRLHDKSKEIAKEKTE